MEKEKEPIVLTESAPLSEWLGRLLEIRWFERGMEIAYQRAAYPEPGQCVTVDYDAYADRLREVLGERMQALLDACPVRLDQPFPETVIGMSGGQGDDGAGVPATTDDETTVANSSDVSDVSVEGQLDAARKALKPGDYVEVLAGEDPDNAAPFPAKVTTVPHLWAGHLVVGVIRNGAHATYLLEGVTPLRKVVPNA